jgi:hypothetical protein
MKVTLDIYSHILPETQEQAARTSIRRSEPPF